jgi:hypothetical protein
MDGKVAPKNCLLIFIFAHNGMESDTHLVCNITSSKKTSQNNLILFEFKCGSQKISHRNNSRGAQYTWPTLYRLENGPGRPDSTNYQK